MKNQWNIISNKGYIDYIQDNSKYFKKSLGQSLTKQTTGGDRELREGNFTTWYYQQHKAMIFKQGEIGQLHFYIDYYLKKDILGFFLNSDIENHQYAIQWEEDDIKEVGIDAWLGRKIKEIDEEIEGVKGEKENKINTKAEGNADKLKVSPGAVTWEDIKKYKMSKNK